MFIAHLPAGYLASHALVRALQNRRRLVLTGSLCAVLPDTDLFWFYFVDNRQTVHHEYLFHWPLFWVAVASVAVALAQLNRKPQAFPYIFVGLACLLLHMLLDSFAAEIYWLRPFSNWHLHMVEVPARYGWWVWNFVFHWTFAVEIVICIAAGLLFWRVRLSR